MAPLISTTVTWPLDILLIPGMMNWSVGRNTLLSCHHPAYGSYCSIRGLLSFSSPLFTFQKSMKENGWTSCTRSDSLQPCWPPQVRGQMSMLACYTRTHPHKTNAHSHMEAPTDILHVRRCLRALTAQRVWICSKAGAGVPMRCRSVWLWSIFTSRKQLGSLTWKSYMHLPKRLTQKTFLQRVWNSGFLMVLSVLYSSYVETHKEHVQDAITEVCLTWRATVLPPHI